MDKTLERIMMYKKMVSCKFKFSHMAKISKIIITGRNEMNVNLQKQNIHVS